MNQPDEKTETRILLIDDDRKLSRLLTDYLEPMGYRLTCVYDGAEGLRASTNEPFQAVILDVMLPGMDGFEVLRQLRRVSDVPVLMLTARGDETDRVVGLEMGADDYLPKPFSPRELLARLRAVMRRFEKKPAAAGAEAADETIIVGPLRVEPGTRAAYLDGAAIDLTSLEFDLLYRLAKSAGRVLTRDQLLGVVAGREYEAFDRSIDVHISSLRRKLNDDPRQPRFIRTVRSSGYMFLRGDGDAE
jgi:DNA-binding response OmpR family regulator